MINWTLLLVFVALLTISLIDLKYKRVPSIFLTSLIIIVAFLNFANLKYALFLGLIGFAIYELAEGNQMSFGVADIKVMIIIGFMISTFTGLWEFLVVFAIIQAGYIFILSKLMKKTSKVQEVPFIIALFVSFLITWIIGGII